jgi:molecular chaperone HscB
MRASTTSTKGLLALATRQQALSITRQAPFVCANCRAIIHRKSITVTRTFATNSACLRQKDSPSPSSQSQREAVVPQTHYDFFPQTFPNGPPPDSPFTPDLKQLRREFLQLQAKAHPDLAPAEQKRHAEALSMRINEAYKTLQDPLRRAQYILSERGIDTEDESAKLSENELLMEVMEAREAIDDAQSEADLVAPKEENNSRIEGSVQKLDQAFAKGDLGSAAKEAIKLRYWMNIDQSIQGWEKGQGGGTIHH